MFSLTTVSKAKLEAALDRAKVEKPLVKEIEFGRYSVRASDGQNYYNVEFKKLDGQIYASCNCQGGRKGVCKHVLATMGNFKMRLVERAAAKAAAPAPTEAELRAMEAELYG